MAFTAVQFTEFPWSSEVGGTCYIEPATVKWLDQRTVTVGVTPTVCVRIHCVSEGRYTAYYVTETMHQVVQLLSGV